MPWIRISCLVQLKSCKPAKCRHKQEWGRGGIKALGLPATIEVIEVVVPRINRTSLLPESRHKCSAVGSIRIHSTSDLTVRCLPHSLVIILSRLIAVSATADAVIVVAKPSHGSGLCIARNGCFMETIRIRWYVVFGIAQTTIYSHRMMCAG
jgi:hypothetical protein